MAKTPVTDALDAQDIQPGDEGWWKVWGARVNDIREGDMIMLKPKGEEITEHVITRIVPESGMAKAVWLRFIDADGEDIRIGRMCAVAVIRKGTHNTLAGSAR